MKRFIACFLAMVLCAVGLAACGDATPLYEVTVKDALGTPYTSGVIVRFLKGGTQVAMQPVDETGVAAKELDKGDYTVELMFTDGEDGYYYNKEGLTLSADTTQLTIELAKKPVGEPSSLYAGGEQRDAYAIADGCTYVTLEAGKRNYFLYTPKVAGTYEFSVSGSTAVIGYYGAPHFVQDHSAADVVDNKFTQSIRADMIGSGNDSGTSVFVVGLDADANTTSATIAINRLGDPEWTISDELWTIYEAKTQPKDYTLPAGATLTAFDLTAPDYKLVLNEKDGAYHLNTADGPLVVMSLGKNTKYINCYKEITDNTGVKKYFYNGDTLTKESFIRKEDYTDCLVKYIACMDEKTGMYPLTEDLKYIVQMHGDHQGWWDEKGTTYLFIDENGVRVPGINVNNAWLLMCYYVE